MTCAAWLKGSSPRSCGGTGAPRDGNLRDYIPPRSGDAHSTSRILVQGVEPRRGPLSAAGTFPRFGRYRQGGGADAAEQPPPPIESYGAEGRLPVGGGSERGGGSGSLRASVGSLAGPERGQAVVDSVRASHAASLAASDREQCSLRASATSLAGSAREHTSWELEGGRRPAASERGQASLRASASSLRASASSLAGTTRSRLTSDLGEVDL
jgi:hypothetical protein